MDLVSFDYQGHGVRTVVIDGVVWFVAKDVCEVLDIGNHTMALRRLDEDEKGFNTIESLGGTQTANIVNESGLYSLILTSRKPEAKAFKKWITSEVLPHIRKTGAYAPQNKSSLHLLLDTVTELVNLSGKVDGLDGKVGDLTVRVNTLEGGALPPGYMPVIRYASKYHIQITNPIAVKIGKTATKLCKQRKIEIHHLIDGRFESVNAYPEPILEEAFKMNLGK